METAFALAALCVSIAGASIDMKSAKIPNWLTGGGLVAGLVLRACLTSWAGLEAGLSGALLGGGILFLPFVVKGIGGGDVKLMAAAGAWVGMEHALALVLATAIAGGFWAVGYMVFRKQTGQTMLRTLQAIQFHLGSGVQSCPDLAGDSGPSIRIPYSLAIASGAFFVLVSLSTSVWR